MALKLPYVESVIAAAVGLLQSKDKNAVAERMRTLRGMLTIVQKDGDDEWQKTIQGFSKRISEFAKRPELGLADEINKLVRVLKDNYNL